MECFFQWVMCMGIFSTGMIVHLINGLSRASGFISFQPFAMLGGFLWCTGNVMAVPAIKTIGLSLGISIWGLTNLITGWSTGAFGLFGLNKDTIANPILNYFGVFFAALSIGAYLYVKPDVTDQRTKLASMIQSNNGEGNMLSEESTLINNTTSTNSSLEEISWLDKLNPVQQRILGCTLSAISGVFYGTNFTPAIYLMQKAHRGDKLDAINYIFSHFCGILMTSTIYFIAYCIVKKKQSIRIC